MSVGILLVTHDGVGSSLLAAARTVLRVLTAPVDVLEVGWACDTHSLRHRANVQRMLAGTEPQLGKSSPVP